MSRNILDVMDNIKEVTTSDKLIEGMERIVYDAGFKAPEVMYQLWNTLQFRLLETYESPFSDDESLKVFSIFTGRSEEELLEIKKEDIGGRQEKMGNSFDKKTE